MPKRKHVTGPISGYSKSSKRAVPKALVPKRRKRNYRASLKLAKPFKQVLDKYLTKDDQTHWVQKNLAFLYQQGIPYITTGGVPVGIYPLMPNIWQAGQIMTPGSTDEQPNNLESREGSKVHLKSMTVHLTVQLTPSYTPTVDPAIRYKIMILTCKKFSEYKELMTEYWDTGSSQNLQSKLFLQGASPEPFNRYMYDWWNPVNTNLFTVHAHKEGVLNRGTVVGSDGHMPFAYRILKMNLKVKNKVLKYNEPTDSLPTNFQPFLWIGYKAFDGSNQTSNAFFASTGTVKLGFESD